MEFKQNNDWKVTSVARWPTNGSSYHPLELHCSNFGLCGRKYIKPKDCFLLDEDLKK